MSQINIFFHIMNVKWIYALFKLKDESQLKQAVDNMITEENM
jgi:hypothetical protein